jgi:hypothetical protein
VFVFGHLALGNLHVNVVGPAPDPSSAWPPPTRGRRTTPRTAPAWPATPGARTTTAPCAVRR